MREAPPARRSLQTLLMAFLMTCQVVSTRGEKGKQIRREKKRNKRREGNPKKKEMEVMQRKYYHRTNS